MLYRNGKLCVFLISVTTMSFVEIILQIPNIRKWDWIIRELLDSFAYNCVYYHWLYRCKLKGSTELHWNKELQMKL